MRAIPREVIKRKLIGLSRDLKRLRENLQLNDFQRDVLIGTLLGDGCLVGNAGDKSYRFQTEHCVKQKNYVFWKYQIFKDWTITFPKFQKRTNSWRFRTISHPVFKEYHTLFYRNRRKIVPREIDLLLNSIGLAVWFMDDGLRKSKNAFSVCVHNFSKQDIVKLQNCLYNNFHLKTNIHWDGKGNLLYFPVSQRERLEKLLSSLILPELKYKFPFY